MKKKISITLLAIVILLNIFGCVEEKKIDEFTNGACTLCLPQGKNIDAAAFDRKNGVKCNEYTFDISSVKFENSYRGDNSYTAVINIDNLKCVDYNYSYYHDYLIEPEICYSLYDETFAKAKLYNEYRENYYDAYNAIIICGNRIKPGNMIENIKFELIGLMPNKKYYLLFGTADEGYHNTTDRGMVQYDYVQKVNGVNVYTSDLLDLYNAQQGIKDINNVEKKQSQWVNENGEWYYYRNNEVVKSEWIQDNDKWYYVGKNGMMLRDIIQTVDGKYYIFDVDGVAKELESVTSKNNDDNMINEQNNNAIQVKETAIESVAEQEFFEVDGVIYDKKTGLRVSAELEDPDLSYLNRSSLTVNDEYEEYKVQIRNDYKNFESSKLKSLVSDLCNCIDYHKENDWKKLYEYSNEKYENYCELLNNGDFIDNDIELIENAVDLFEGFRDEAENQLEE